METKKNNIQVLSKTDNLRLYIIEHTLSIETLISETIGSFLNVDYKSSKSFGFSSSSLSFNQKTQIIQDIKGLDSVMALKLTYLMNIRNKFVHVQEVDSFEKFFEIAKNGNEIKKKLERWYSLESKKENDDKYKFSFYKLCEEITTMLWDLQVQDRTEKSKLQAKTVFQTAQLESFKEIITESQNSKEINSKVLKKTIKKVPFLGIKKEE